MRFVTITSVIALCAGLAAAVPAFLAPRGAQTQYDDCEVSIEVVSIEEQSYSQTCTVVKDAWKNKEETCTTTEEDITVKYEIITVESDGFECTFEYVNLSASEEDESEAETETPSGTTVVASFQTQTLSAVVESVSCSATASYN